MTKILDMLEWLAKYGLVDIFFGLGVTGIIYGFVQKLFPSNYSHFHINVSRGGPVGISGIECSYSINFSLRNAGSANFYVARAYFSPKLRHWYSLWLMRTSTRLRIHPRSDRIADKDAFELKFQGQAQVFSEYEALIPPGHVNGVTTFLALEEPLREQDISKRECGVLYVEYATGGKQGIHRVRV